MNLDNNFSVENIEEIQNNKMNYWAPIKEVRDCVEKFCKDNNYKQILEIGPGLIPFPLATKTIGCNEKVRDYIDIDIDVTPLPFDNKSFDFVYSRHTLEDIQNPDFVMREIVRISNSGFIETPSPLIEITKGVDFTSETNNYTGYIHHRYIIWSNIEKCEIYFLPKYSVIIEHFMKLNVNSDIYRSSMNWNNYFIWKDKEPKIIVYKNAVNIGLKNNLAEDYVNLLVEATKSSVENTNYFIKNYNVFA